MKPSQRIRQLCHEVAQEAGAPSPTVSQLMDAMPIATARYLDELWAARSDDLLNKLDILSGLK